MIKIYLGNLGSGKTVSAVREMYMNENKRITYSNIITKLKNQININPSMIIKQDIIDYKKKRTGELEPVYKTTLNIDYWKNLKAPINVILDEAHSIINARRAMTKINIIVSDWIALIRRVLGQTEAGSGELILISQLERRLDPIARDMATQVRFHLMHYAKSCKDCLVGWQENSEMPEAVSKCLSCSSTNLIRHSFTVEVWYFSSMQMYDLWKNYAQSTFYKHVYIRDIDNYFKYYSTLQWDNLFSEYY